MSLRSDGKVAQSVYDQQESMTNFQPYCGDTPKCQSLQESQRKNDSEEIHDVPANVDTPEILADQSPALQNVRFLAGEWGAHRFEKEAWYDKNKSFSALMKNRRTIPREESSEQLYREEEDVEDDDSVHSDILTDDVIKSCLSYLERSPINLMYVLCKCVLSNKGLSDISAIKYFHYLQYLNISKNELTTLAALGQLPFLQHLDASFNNLESVLDFKAPFFLTFVNLSFNSIRAISDLTEFWSITDLDLSHNNIEKIDGLENLRFLNNLDLSFNKIVALENLNNLRIQVLNLNHNLIDSSAVEDDPIQFKTLDYIRLVYLSHNRISTLEVFESAYSIEEIDLYNNNISNLLELYNLANLKFLSRLNLKNNPVTSMKYYFNVCADVMKNLIMLDGKKISAERRVSVKTNINPLVPGKVCHAQLVLLQQINHPNIAPYILPANHPLPIVIVLVGPPGSRKGSVVRKFCRTTNMLVQGVSYTTRPKVEGEVDGQDYYFISCEEFKNLARNGDFVAVSEFNGHSFGITHEEIFRAVDKILVFHADLGSAVSLKESGVNPKLVLAMPRNEDTHLTWLKDKYSYNEKNQDIVRSQSNTKFDQSSLKDSRTQLVKEKTNVVGEAQSKIRSKDDLERDTAASLSTFVTELSTVDGTEVSCASKKDVSTEKEPLWRGYKKVSFNENSISAQNLTRADKKKGIQFVQGDVGYNFGSEFLEREEDKAEKLDLFFKKIIKSREEFLEIHWAHPGLFHTIIFTDEGKLCLKTLKNILSNTVEANSIVDSSLSTEDDDTYDRIVKIRLTSLDFQGFTRLRNDVPGHCDCDVKYIEKHF